MKWRHEFLIVTGTLLAALCQSSAQSPAPSEPPAEVTLVRPSRGSITRSVNLPAELKAYQQATLCAKVAGYLKTINVDKGDSVKAGALIAEIEVPELTADLAKSKAELSVAELDFKRLSESQTKAPDLVVPLTVDNAEAKVEVAKANLERTETLLSFAKITAPFAGTITRRMVDPGAFIPAATSGNAQGAAIVTIADFTKIRVQTAVPEAEAPLIKVGQPAKIAIESLPEKKIEGKITRFSYALDEATKTMLAEIELDNPKLELRPGMYAMARVGVEQKQDVLLLPNDAVLTEKSGSSVFQVIDGKTKKTKVQTGFNDGTKTEIVSGLQPDQPVVIIGKKTFVDAQPVKVVETK
jgi:membrane fusion protein (multidrug efflux system)